MALAGYAGMAQAQAVGGGAPPLHSQVDGNGVDLISGDFTISTTDVVIGQPGQGGLVYARSFYKDSWQDGGVGTIQSVEDVYIVSFSGGAGTFTLSGGVYTPDQADGSSLAFDATTQIYTYTTRDGVVATFAKALAETDPLEANEGKVTSVTLPSGEKTTYSYKTVAIGGVNYNRLQSVTNNLGYQLKYEYTLATPTTTAQLADFRNITKVTGLNNAVDYCDPSADACTYSQAWPYAAYAKPTTTTSTVTNPLGAVTRYTYDSLGRISGIKRPSSSTDTTTVTYDIGYGSVRTVVQGGSTWTYAFDRLDETVSAWITDPLSNYWNIAVSDGGRLTTWRDALGRAQTYQYDTDGRLTRATGPGGEYAQYAYDARGNVTSTTQVAASGSGLANIVTSATYPATCANPVTCNLPLTTTAANGAVTDYTYDTTHGGLMSVTAPAPTTGAVRPQTRVSYTPLYAWYKNSGGTITQAGTPVYRMTGASTCITGSSCDWTANESWTTTYYGPSGVASNLLPAVSSAGSGDGALTVTTARTYDAVGNLLTIDGPLSGAADTTRYRYDAARRPVGVVGPDPDAGGALKHRGVRYGYNLDGQITTVDTINVNSQSDADWAAAVVKQQQAITYDAQGRTTHERLIAGGATHSLVQYSYDTVGRLDCTALRMNAATFASPPASACTLATAGADGPDRITRTTYNIAGQPLKSIGALGTLQQADDVTLTYNSRGAVATAADALGGLTTYEYDGFGRQKKVRYPTASNRTVSSTTDYEEVTYDAYGRLSQERRRDGQLFGVSYDQLGRVTTIDAPTGMNDVTYGYDNRTVTSVAAGGQTLTYSYDALGRQLTAGGPLGTVSYQYDAAGRRTRMTWPDSFYVTYNYDAVGAMTEIHQNGATQIIGLVYDDLGRRTTLMRRNGVATYYSYDEASRLTGLSLDLVGTAQDQAYSFSYNSAFQAKSRTGSNTAFAPTAAPTGTQAYTSNGLNQLTTAGSATLSYDGRGNLSGDGVNTYGYDAANRLTGASGATLAYDPSGRLYQTTGSATTRFAYDGVDLIGEYDASGNILRRYIHGPSVDEPLVWVEEGAADTWRYLSTDQLGSVVAVTGGAGAVLGINTYDEYGIPGGGNLGRFSYTGQTWIPEAGLAHYKARAYAPTLGRFLQPDPIGYGDGMNLYGYVAGDPLNLVDPFGLMTEVRLCWVVKTPPQESNESTDIYGMKCIFADLEKILPGVDLDPGSIIYIAPPEGALDRESICNAAWSVANKVPSPGVTAARAQNYQALEYDLKRAQGNLDVWGPVDGFFQGVAIGAVVTTGAGAAAGKSLGISSSKLGVPVRVGLGAAAVFSAIELTASISVSRANSKIPGIEARIQAHKVCGTNK